MTFDLRRLAIAINGFCTFLNLYSPQALLPELSREFGATAAQISTIMTASTLAVALTAPVTGAIADVFGRKRLITAALFAVSIPTVMLVFASDVVKKGWLAVHILMIFTGYAALFLSFGASILYLMQERALKSKSSSGMFSRLPALQVIDDIGYRSLMLGFPFMTLGLIAGSVVAEATYGRIDFLDPKILLSVLMWAVYLLMVFTRLNAGWRGRRAALLASAAFVTAVVAWSANYFSAMHRFIAS